MSRRRFIEMGIAGGLGITALSARLVQLQILDGASHRDRAEGNRIRTTRVPAPRGLIYDRNRVPLARNRPSFTVSVVPADLPASPDPVLRRLARIVGGSAADIRRKAERSVDPVARIPIRTSTDPRLAHAVGERQSELPGVYVDVEPAREYMDGALTSHVLGHVGPITEEQFRAAGSDRGPYRATDRVGQSGVETQLETELRGTRGERRVEVDASGREVGTISLDPAMAGSSVLLTIDLALQREANRALAERIHQFEVGSVVVVDPNSGHVLAMAHLPSFDNQMLSDGVGEDEFARLMADPSRPLLNGSISSGWPPGSTFKVVTALAALQTGIVRPETKVHCGGGIRLPGGARLGCWTAHGEQDMVAALANSCDTYFYHLAGGEPNGRWPGLGPERLAEWARAFGLGAPTGISLPAEAAGIVPDPAWKRAMFKEPWYPGDTYISGIGQGFYTATPLQMAMVAAAFANGGTLLKPQIVAEVADGRTGQTRRTEAEVVRKIAADDIHVRLVRDGVRAGMQIGVTPSGARYTGTSWDSDIKGVPMAGKTGTSEYGVKGPDGKLPTHGWFIFWAPHEAPRIAGSVFVKQGRGAQEAAKVANRVVRSYFGIV